MVWNLMILDGQGMVWDGIYWNWIVLENQDWKKGLIFKSVVLGEQDFMEKDQIDCVGLNRQIKLGIVG